MNIPLKAVTALWLSIGLIGGAFAQSAKQPSAKTGAASAVSQGQRIATSGAPNGVTACISCHGAKGEGVPGAGFPRIGGQSQHYLQRQLMMFAGDARKNPIMSPIAKAMNKQQMESVSAYYAGLTAPPTKPANAPAKDIVERGRILAESGDESRQVQACANCHGPGGIGSDVTFPYLAGQHQDFLQASMTAWKNGSRNTDPSLQMPHIASQLSDEDIAAVAAYYATQAPPSPLDGRRNIPAGSAARPIPPPSRSTTHPQGSGSAQGTGTEQGAPTSGGNQGPGGGGSTQVGPRGPLPPR